MARMLKLVPVPSFIYLYENMMLFNRQGTLAAYQLRNVLVSILFNQNGISNFEILNYLNEWLIVFSRSKPQYYRGIGGKTIEVAVNYMKLEVGQGYGIFEYEVLFEPSVDSRGERYSAVNQHRELLGLTKYVILLVREHT